MSLQILKYDLLEAFREIVTSSPLETILKNEKKDLPIDYFNFYNSVSSVYSSKIEGENIDFDSFFKHKFLNVNYKLTYTKRVDDLFSAYEFIHKNSLTFDNIQKAHSILASNLLPKSQQGLIRNNPMFVFNSEDKIEYVAVNPSRVKPELNKLFNDIDYLLQQKLDDFESFYFAAYIHLVFVKNHPFQDGNGRTARLLEKWFLKEKLGQKATSVQLEKNYYTHLNQYLALTVGNNNVS